jgi:hypothetical protein
MRTAFFWLYCTRQSGKLPLRERPKLSRRFSKNLACLGCLDMAQNTGFPRYGWVRPAWIFVSLAAAQLWLAPVSPTWAADDDVRPHRIRIEYEPPTSPALVPYYQLAKQRKALEKVQELFSPLRLPDEIIVRTKECGVSNAWYQRPAVTLCYEYLRDIIDMAPQEASRDGITPADAVLGQFLFTASHEMGHAVFDFLDVPIMGRPEDAADYFAIYILLKIGKKDARKLIEGASYMYKDYVGRPVVTVPLTAFADIHGSPMQRFYDLLCIGYGSDAELLSGLMEFLPKERVPNCKVEFGEVNFAFQKLIEPHVDQNVKAQILSQNWVPEDNAPPPRLTDVPPSKRGTVPEEGSQQSLK